MNNLKNDLLSALIATAESKNLYLAAEKLGLSQAGISMKLKELESEAPVPLFGYEGKRKILTHYGREMYELAKVSERQFEENYESLNRKYADEKSLTLRVGCRREIFGAVAHKLTFAGTLQFSSLSSEQAVRHLLEHKIDIAISYERPDSLEVVAKKLMESSAKLVVHKKFLKTKLTSALVKQPEFLTEVPCVLYQKKGHLISDWIAPLSIPREKLTVRGIADDWRAVQALVDQGWGYAIVPSYVDSHNRDVQAIDLPTAVLPKYSFYMLFHKNLKKVPAFKSVLDFQA